jgi:hypothetical protein
MKYIPFTQQSVPSDPLRPVFSSLFFSASGEALPSIGDRSAPSSRHFDRSEAERRNLLLNAARLSRGFLHAPARHERAWSK